MGQITVVQQPANPSALPAIVQQPSISAGQTTVSTAAQLNVPTLQQQLASQASGVVQLANISAAAQLSNRTTVSAVIDTRLYGVCQLVAANTTGGIIQGGVGSLQKSATTKINDIITYTCAGTGIQNLFNQTVNFSAFPCTIVDSTGFRNSATLSVATLMPNGAESLACSYNLTLAAILASAVNG